MSVHILEKMQNAIEMVIPLVRVSLISRCMYHFPHGKTTLCRGNFPIYHIYLFIMS